MQGHGWAGDMRDVERRREVVMRYNKSSVYVNTVLALADYLHQHK